MPIEHVAQVRRNSGHHALWKEPLMKKVLIGCGIMLLLMVVAVVGIGIFGVRKISQYGDSLAQAQESLTALEQDFAFDIPAEDVSMDPDRFHSYLATRQALVDRTRQVRLVDLLTTAEEGQQPPAISVGDVFNLVGEIPKLMQSYADTLRAAEMSPEEYAWYAMETLKAVRGAAERGDPEYAAAWDEMMGLAREMEQAFAQQQSPEVRELQASVNDMLDSAQESEVPEQDVQLVIDNKEQLAEQPALLLVEVLVTLFLNNTFSATTY